MYVKLDGGCGCDERVVVVWIWVRLWMGIGEMLRDVGEMLNEMHEM